MVEINETLESQILSLIRLLFFLFWFSSHPPFVAGTLKKKKKKKKWSETVRILEKKITKCPEQYSATKGQHLKLKNKPEIWKEITQKSF